MLLHLLAEINLEQAEKGERVKEEKGAKAKGEISKG